MRAKLSWLFNVAEKVCSFGVKTPPTCVVCVFVGIKFISRENTKHKEKAIGTKEPRCIH